MVGVRLTRAYGGAQLQSLQRNPSLPCPSQPHAPSPPPASPSPLQPQPLTVGQHSAHDDIQMERNTLLARLGTPPSSVPYMAPRRPRSSPSRMAQSLRPIPPAPQAARVPAPCLLFRSPRTRAPAYPSPRSYFAAPWLHPTLLHPPAPTCRSGKSPTKGISFTTLSVRLESVGGVGVGHGGWSEGNYGCSTGDQGTVLRRATGSMTAVRWASRGCQEHVGGWARPRPANAC